MYSRNSECHPSPIDQYDQGGRDKLADRFRQFVDSGQPIRFSLMGYPFKSMNHRDKVLGSLPDLGERASLNNFGDFAARISALYTPGARFSIISDGYAFSAFYGTPDSEVAEYTEIVRDMSHRLPIDWYDIFSFYPRSLGADLIREKIVEQFGITSVELENRILNNPDVNALYRGFIKFMHEDLAIKNYPSGAQLQKAAKIMARGLLFKNEAYSKLVQSEFQDHIRLSMHQSQNNGAKYSIRLIKSDKYRHSPWMSALLINTDGTLETIHRKDAEAAGHELVYENNQPYYFVQK